MSLCYFEHGASATLPHPRKFSPLQDLDFIQSLSDPERAGMDALIPMLSMFIQSTCPELEEREQAAVNAHMAQSSEPPWFVDGHGLKPWWANEDQGPRYPKPAEMTQPDGGYSRCVYCAQPTLGGINCNCEGEQYHRDTVREHLKLSATQRRERELSEEGLFQFTIDLTMIGLGHVD